MAEKGWTPTPNLILDNMANMKPAVFKVCMVVVRQTCGYVDEEGKNRKEWDKLSTSRIMELSGLSNRAVIDAVEEAIEQGWIERRPSGQYFEYRLQPMKKVHSFSNETYEKSSQVDEENSPTYEKSSQEPMKKVHTQKKKENKRNNTSANAEATPEKINKEPTDQQRYFGKICEIVGFDSAVITEEQKGQVAQTSGILKKAGYTLDDLCRFGKEVWVNDWRWQKKKQRPTLTELRAEIGKLKKSDTFTNDDVPKISNQVEFSLGGLFQ